MISRRSGVAIGTEVELPSEVFGSVLSVVRSTGSSMRDLIAEGSSYRGAMSVEDKRG